MSTGDGDLEARRISVLAEEIAAPATHERLLELIVETAAGVISAEAGALFLIDEEAGDLVFQVAIGAKQSEVKDLRVPLGHGIAGGVAATGIPLAISNASSDPRWAKDIGERAGYAPESIACVPLLAEDRVIGALELLDKQGAASFSPEDLHALSLFARQAAVAIEQSRNRLDASALAAGHGDGAFPGALELARLVHEIAQAGEREARACHELLTAFAAYIRSQR